jgi:hypothetical protein
MCSRINSRHRIRQLPRSRRRAIAIRAHARRSLLREEHARLVYVRETGAEKCPGEVDLRLRVVARLGYDPFSPQASQVVLARIEARAGELHGSETPEPGSDRCVVETRDGEPEPECTVDDRPVYCAQLLCGQEASYCQCDSSCCDASTMMFTVPVDLHWDDGALEGFVNKDGGAQPIFLDPVSNP